MSKRKTILLIILAALIIVVYTQVTFFVIQPIGAVPGGRTLVIWRTGKLKFIDSADALCSREVNGVSLLCRIAVLGDRRRQDLREVGDRDRNDLIAHLHDSRRSGRRHLIGVVDRARHARDERFRGHPYPVQVKVMPKGGLNQRLCRTRKGVVKGGGVASIVGSRDEELSEMGLELQQAIEIHLAGGKEGRTLSTAVQPAIEQ